MKTTVTLALAALTIGFAAPVMAEAVDVSTLTCEAVSTMDKDTVGALLMWMDGYTGGTVEDATFDPERLGQNVDDAIAACGADASRSLLEVMQEVSIETAE